MMQFLEESWTFVDKAVGCIERLLGEDGLLPISVSHEGYLAQPVHSYWDDFWALRGLRDAVGLAQALGRQDAAQRWQALSARFASSLFASIEATRAQRKLDFIPGSIEWADFDPTATANAIYLHDVPDGAQPPGRRANLRSSISPTGAASASGAVASPSYTPYEIRIIGALVRLGRRDAALELLRFFLSDRRPPPWNQWPEIAWRDHKAPAHIGDLPHTWIAAEYVLAVRSLFAYEREADQCLVLAAGLAPEWIEGAGVRVHGMPTLYGSLSYSLRRIDPHTLRFEIGGGITGKLCSASAAGGAAAQRDGQRQRQCASFDADSRDGASCPRRGRLHHLLIRSAALRSRRRIASSARSYLKGPTGILPHRARGRVLSTVKDRSTENLRRRATGRGGRFGPGARARHDDPCDLRLAGGQDAGAAE